ncbi:MAG TPA: GNAT family N-acetyltransferase [Longimicrobium sp.]|jgi:ribosomal-protein-alanine N-acetyltransferase
MLPLREPPVLNTARLTLRLPEPDDAEAISRYFDENREHLASTRPRMDAEFFTADFWRAQAQASRSEFRGDRSLRLFMWEKADPGRVIASANFTQFVRGAAQYCVLGYGIASDREGQGLMREGLEVAIEYVFRELNMHRVMANFFPWNRRSGGLLRRLGFVVEGYARDYLYLDGEWQDHVLTSLTNPNWRPDR